MSRCQHGQVISKFCISDTCTWREAGGCDVCFRKYHAHATNLDIIPLAKLETINATLSVKADVKVKVRPLQEAVYNYFMIMKSQISSSLDAVSRVLNNRLSYPYLSHQDQLAVHKKIKNREFKKISKKELKNFYDFASNVSSETLEHQQRSLYYLEVSRTAEIFKKINGIFKDYQQTVSLLDPSFNVEKSFLDKISQITAAIKNAQKQGTMTEGGSTIGSNTKNQKNYLQVEQKKNSRDRKISFDTNIGNHDFSQFQQKYKSPESYDQNQKQIMQKKKKLLDMLSGPKHNQAKVDQIKVQFDTKKEEIMETPDKKINDNLSQKNKSKSQERGNHSLDKSIVGSGKDRKKPTPLFIEGSLKRYADSGNKSQKGDNASEKNSEIFGSNLFSDLIEKGLNIPQMLVHTIIPQGQEKKKLYEDTKDVKEQKITVPVKKFQELEEASSPLLKKRKTKGAGNFNLFKIESNRQGQLEGIEQQQTPQKKPIEQQAIMQEKEEQMVLKEKQADSLALLVQSLRLPAEKAIAMLEASVKYASNNLSATQYLSYLYLETGQPKKCLDLCNDMLEQLEDSPQASKLSVHISNNKAAALNILGRYSESISILEKCLEYSCKDIYFKNLGDAYFSIGIFQKAAFNYEKAVTLNKEMDEAYYNLAVCLFFQGYFNESKLYVQKALKVNGKNPEYLQLLKEVSAKTQI